MVTHGSFQQLEHASTQRADRSVRSCVALLAGRFQLATQCEQLCSYVVVIDVLKTNADRGERLIDRFDLSKTFEHRGWCEPRESLCDPLARAEALITNAGMQSMSFAL